MAVTPATNPNSNALSPAFEERQLVIPFVNAPPLVDVVLLIALLPVWWALGVDQFIWMAGGAWAALRLCIRNQWRVRVPRSLRLLALFFGVQLLSAFFIVESERYVTFARTFGAYVAAFCIALVIVNEVRQVRDLKLLLAVLIGVIVIAAGAGALAQVGVWRPFYKAPITLVIPESLQNTDYGTTLVTRRLGIDAWFSLFGSYYRLSGFFLYGTGYASALMLTIPLALFHFWRARPFSRALWVIVLLLLGVNLLFTTGRIAMLGLVIGFAYFVLTGSRWRTLSRITLIFGCIAVGVGLGISASLEGELPEGITRIVNDVALARGQGSPIERGRVYEATLQNFFERPVFGWGTERDLPTMGHYPAGSHNYYLGVLYKYGIVGLIAFLAMWMVVWRETAPPRIAAPEAGERRELVRLLWYGRWIVIGALVNGVSEVLDLDTSVLVFLWIIIAALICARQLAVARPAYNDINHCT